MAKHLQTTENNKQNRQVRRAVTVPPQGQVELTDQLELLNRTEADTIQAQAMQLDNSRLQTAQRQALAAQIGRMQGNQHLQRVIASISSADKMAPYQPDIGKSPPGSANGTVMKKSTNGSHATVTRKSNVIEVVGDEGSEVMRSPDLETRGAYWERSMRALPPLRGRRSVRVPPATPATERHRWRERIRTAMGERGRSRRARAYLQLINEAVGSDAGRFPELTLPVTLFRSNRAARLGGVYFDINLPGSPGPSVGTQNRAVTRTRSGRGSTPRVFIIMGPAALHREDGPVYTQRTLHHEYVHFLQNLHGQLTTSPACRATWQGRPVGGNPNREIVAVSTTFARFFPEWADTARPNVTDYPRYLTVDLAFMQAYFRCVNEQLRTDAIARIVATVQGHPARRRHLQGMIQFVRSRSLPNIHLRQSDDAMARLSSAMGRQLPPDPRLPITQRQPLAAPNERVIQQEAIISDTVIQKDRTKEAGTPSWAQQVSTAHGHLRANRRAAATRLYQALIAQVANTIPRASYPASLTSSTSGAPAPARITPQMIMVNLTNRPGGAETFPSEVEADHGNPAHLWEWIEFHEEALVTTQEWTQGLILHELQHAGDMAAAFNQWRRLATQSRGLWLDYWNNWKRRHPQRHVGIYETQAQGGRFAAWSDEEKLEWMAGVLGNIPENLSRNATFPGHTLITGFYRQPASRSLRGRIVTLFYNFLFGTFRIRTTPRQRVSILRNFAPIIADLRRSRYRNQVQGGIQILEQVLRIRI